MRSAAPGQHVCKRAEPGSADPQDRTSTFTWPTPVASWKPSGDL